MSERGGAPATQPVSPVPTSSYPAANDPGATWAWLVPSAQDLPPLALTHTTYKVGQPGISICPFSVFFRTTKN